jgi:cytochrome c-type biogenesis protein
VSTLILGLAYGAKSALRRRQTLLRSLADRAKPIMGVVFILVGTALWFRLNHVVEAWLIDTLPVWLIDFSVSL